MNCTILFQTFFFCFLYNGDREIHSPAHNFINKSTFILNFTNLSDLLDNPFIIEIFIDYFYSRSIFCGGPHIGSMGGGP